MAQESRAVVLMSAKIPTGSWTRLNVVAKDVVGVRVEAGGRTIRIFNIYNDCTHARSTRALHNYLNSAEGRRTRGRQNTDLWVGDFNRHHPMWDEPRNHHLFTRPNLDAAEELIEVVGQNRMAMALRPEVATLEAKNTKNFTRPDNVFISGDAMGEVLRCEAMREAQPPKTDHFPIITKIAAHIQQNKTTVRRNFRKVDWKEFRTVLGGKLEGIPQTRITEPRDVERRLERVMVALQETVEEVVPEMKESKYAKRWWNEELTERRREAKRKGRQSRLHMGDPEHPSHEAFRRARNDYSQAIKDAKRTHWVEWLESIDEKTVWDAKNLATANPGDGGRSRVPALRGRAGGRAGEEVGDNEGKAKLFHNAFFYDAPEEVEVGREDEYPAPAFEWTPITDKEIHNAISKLKPHKAPGLSGIPNVVIMKARFSLVPYLGPIYRGTFDHKVYPSRWKTFKTIVLRKHGKDNYSDPNSYRPIALLDTVAKVLSSCVKTRLAFYAEKHHMLPQHQFGGRPGRSTTDSMHMLASFVKDAWRKGREVVALFLDVKGAFPNTVPKVLSHEMRKRGVPAEVTEWFDRKLEGRTTTIAFDDYESRPIPVNSGLDQGCNTSGLCYNFYNAGQVENARRKDGELAASFADDAVVAADGADLGEAARKVEGMMGREGGGTEWARKHYSIFEKHKFAAVGFTRRREKHPTKAKATIPAKRPTLTIDGTVIKTATSHKFLGVILDQELRFKEHAAYAHGKGMAVATHVKRLSKTNGGMRGAQGRRVYEAVVVPTMLYAADVWCTPDVVTKNGAVVKGSRGYMKKMERVQRMGMIQMMGAYRTTPNDVLEAHTNITPISMRIQQICARAGARIATMPSSHPLCKPARRAAKFVKRHRAPLHYVIQTFGKDPRKVETIEPTRKPPDWEPEIPAIIDEKEEEAIDRERRNEAEVRVYTDGSGYKGGVGAAAVLYRGFRRAVVMRAYLGPEEEHTVFEGECVGQVMGWELVRREVKARGRFNQATVGTDNQASIQAMEREGGGPANYIINAALEAHAKLTREAPHVSTSLRWVPAHKGIPGNERADREAKRAAEGDQTETGIRILRKPLPISRSAVMATHKAKWKAQIRTFRTQSERLERMRSVDNNMPDARIFCNTISQLPRKHAAILFQLRAGHCPLNQYLHRFKKSDDPRCAACGGAEESVRHFLIECPAYRNHRTILHRAARPGPRYMATLLGDPNMTRPLFAYIKATRRFDDMLGDLEIAFDIEKPTPRTGATQR